MPPKAKKIDTKKKEPKKAVTKKTEPKKAAAKKTEPKKVAAKKTEPKKVTAKTIETKKKTRPSKKSPPAAVESSESIEAMTSAFLKAGGEVQKIPSGVSGQESMAPGRKHITLGNNNKQG